jgi:hypothetical protein
MHMKDDRLHWWKGWFIQKDGHFDAAKCFLAYSAAVFVGLPGLSIIIMNLVWELHILRHWSVPATMAVCCAVVMTLLYGIRALLGRLVRRRLEIHAKL